MTNLYLPNLIRATPTTARLWTDIYAAGGRAYMVGGCVRDALMGNHEPKDIDIEVYDVELDALISALSVRAPVSLVGVQFGVLKTTRDGIDFDISLPRIDSKTGTGHKGFTTVSSPYITVREAASRRDFTINAISWDPITGEVIDDWHGVQDLESRVLRATTHAFDEDPLRVLRGIQFAGRFGFTFDWHTVERCRGLVFHYNELAKERIWEEWYKLLTRGTYIGLSMQMLRSVGWDIHFPELMSLYGVPQDERWHPEGDVWVHSCMAADKAARLHLPAHEKVVIVLAALLHDLGKSSTTRIQTTGRWAVSGEVEISSPGHAHAGMVPARSFMERIGAPESIIVQVVALVREHMAATNVEPTATTVRRLARRLLPCTIEQWALVVQADRAGRGPASSNANHVSVERWLNIARELKVQERPMPNFLTGDHLIAAGLIPGPQFSIILKHAQQAQDDGHIFDEASALAWFSVTENRA